MYLFKKSTLSKSLLTQIALFLVISILICFMGYMFGKFFYYLSH
jgi:hypothetical protein